MALSKRDSPDIPQPGFTINKILLITFCAVWIRNLLFWFFKDAFGTSLNYWAFTDWLIDYSQGFIRRGLSGEIWRLFPSGMSRLEMVAIFSWVLILAVVLGYVRLLVRSYKNIHPLTLFGLLFMPSLFFFYLHDHNAIGRKETLGYVVMLIHLLVIEKSFPLGDLLTPVGGKLRHYIYRLLPVTVLFLPVTILIHEGNFLLFVPLHAMITLTFMRMESQSGFLRAASLTGLLYLPAAVTFGAVYLTGTPAYQALLGICNNWLAVGAVREGACVLPPEGLSGSTLPAALIPMQWSLAKAVSITRMVISRNWQAWLITLPVLGAMLWYLVRQVVYAVLRFNIKQGFSSQTTIRYTGLFFRKYFLVPVLFSLPIYFTAYDYGRWFTIACVNFSILAVSANLPCREFAHHNKGADDADAADDPPGHADHWLIFYGVSALICILALIIWLPHYCLFNCEIIHSPLEFLSFMYDVR